MIDTGSIKLIGDWTEKHRPVREPLHQCERYAFFRDQAVGNILSIGCGEAKVEEYICVRDNGECDHNVPICGADLDPAFVQSAIDRWPNGRFVVYDICGKKRIRFLNDEFDTVIIGDVMEHVSPYYHHTLLSEAIRVSKPGGRVLITVPNGSYFGDNNASSIYAKEHCMVMTWNVIKNILDPGPEAREWWLLSKTAWHNFKYEYTMEMAQSKRFIFINITNRK